MSAPVRVLLVGVLLSCAPTAADGSDLLSALRCRALLDGGPERVESSWSSAVVDACAEVFALDRCPSVWERLRDTPLRDRAASILAECLPAYCADLPALDLCRSEGRVVAPGRFVAFHVAATAIDSGVPPADAPERWVHYSAAFYDAAFIGVGGYLPSTRSDVRVESGALRGSAITEPGPATEVAPTAEPELRVLVEEDVGVVEVVILRGEAATPLRLDLETLADDLRTLGPPPERASIAADASVPYHHIVTVMSALTTAGVNQISFVVRAE